MSQLLKDFVTVLKTTLPTVTIRPALGKQYALPAAIYSVRNGVRDLFYVGSYGMKSTEFTVTIYSKSYEEIQDLKALVVNQFHGFSGDLETSTVSKIEVSNILDGYDDALETIHRTTFVLIVSD